MDSALKMGRFYFNALGIIIRTMNKKIKVKLIGWDLDGTLLNGLEGQYQAMCNTFKTFNVPYPSKQEYGDEMTHDISAFYKRHGLDVTEEQLRQIFRETLEKLPPPKIFKGAKNILKNIHKGSIKQFLITLASEYRAAPFMTSHGLEKFFSGIFLETGNKKEVLEKIAKENRAGRKEFIYVGDTRADIEAANTAGAISIGFTNGFASRESLEMSNPDFLIERHEELFDILDL